MGSELKAVLEAFREANDELRAALRRCHAALGERLDEEPESHGDFLDLADRVVAGIERRNLAIDGQTSGSLGRHIAGLRGVDLGELQLAGEDYLHNVMRVCIVDWANWHSFGARTIPYVIDTDHVRPLTEGELTKVRDACDAHVARLREERPLEANTSLCGRCGNVGSIAGELGGAVVCPCCNGKVPDR